MVKMIRNINKNTWILLAIILVGIFLRTYNFHDGVRFNADQARDATLVSQVIDGEEAWPLLGPKAGGTDFRLGPIFYELQIISGKIFGNAPDKFAYPDLFFSILSIPLLFFFLRKYFETQTTTWLTALYAVSFYAIKYSRFAWNPNSTPFWTILFLYALLQIVDCKNKQRIFWSTVAGIAIGIGVQLHTFLLVIMPILTIGYFIYLGFKKNNLWKNFIIILAVSLFLNIPQLNNEVKTGGENTKAFFKGVTAEKENEPFLIKIGKAGECFMTASAFTATSLGNSDKCASLDDMDGENAISIIFGGILFLGGMGLGISRLREESNVSKKRFLGLIFAYTGLVFAIIVPVAYEVSLRYFLIISFLPFILLGFWGNFLEEKFQKKGMMMVALFIGVLICVNLGSVKNNFSALAEYTQNSSMAGFNNVFLGELEMMAGYIASHDDLSRDVLLDGNSKYMFKASKGLIYLAEKKGVRLQKLDKKNNQAGNIVFNLISTKSKNKKIKALGDSADILEYKSFGRFALIKARLKN